MKKVIRILTAFVLVLSMSLTAYAATRSDSRNVIAQYTQTTTEDAVYSIEMTWDDLTFTYIEQTINTWDPDTHTYTTQTGGGWNKTTATVKVTNHSNVAVDVEMTLTSVTGTGVNVGLVGGDATLAAGTVGNVSGAESVSGLITVSGKPNSSVTATGVSIGKITVTVKSNSES